VLKAYSRLLQQLMLVCDLLLVAGCWLLAYGVRFYVIVPPITGGGVPPLGPYLLMLLPILLVWGVSFHAFGRAASDRTSRRRPTSPRPPPWAPSYWWR
jgi:hypothetical protein